MKRILLTFVLLAATALVSQAIPAYPYPIKITQPDGSRITIQLFGDEHFHWVQTTDGYDIIQREDGFYYYDAQTLAPVRAHDTAQRGVADRQVLGSTHRGMPADGFQIARQSRMLREIAANQQSDANVQGRMKAQAAGDKFHSLVILVNFTDLKFTVANPQQAFSNLLNQNGYSVNGATGSAWNYYQDNSNGRFDGSFDVVGPYELPQSMSYYGGNGSSGSGGDTGVSSQAFFKNTIAAVGTSVDWSQYADGSTVRSVFIFYAGYNEAEGGPAASIWPHQWGITTKTSNNQYTVNGYACSSEYKGSSGGVMAGIGTFCHEFGHVLGWPDFYDTDYNSNGYALNPDYFSLMAGGAYNNQGRTPPALMAQERDMQGWLVNTQTLSVSGNYTLPHVAGDYAYRISTATSGEYFYIETRGSSNKWDAGFGSSWGGILVMHVDRSSSYLSRWNSNTLNAYSAHPCYMPIRANGSGSTATTNVTATTAWLFGSTYSSLNSTSYPLFKAWSGTAVDGSFTYISYSAGSTSFTFTTGGSLPSVEPTGVTVSPSSGSVSVGGTLPLTATVVPSDAANKTVTWTSDKTNIATVSADGVVTGVALGTATITAKTVNNKTATCIITVRQLATAINLSQSSLLLDVNQIITLTAEILPANAEDKTVSWTSSNPAVATVSGGAVCGIAAGEAIVTVQAVGTNVKATCAVRVLAPISEIDASVLQNDAILSWEYEWGGSFRVEFQKGNDKVGEFTVPGKSIYLPMLAAGTTWVATVYPVDELGTAVGTAKKSKIFKTPANSTEYVAMGLIHGIFDASETIPLRAINLPSDVTSVAWKVDGQAVEAPEVTLSAGRHSLELTVKAGNNSEIIRKIITVK